MSKLLPALRMLFVALVTLGLLASPAMAQDETDTDGGEGLLETVTDLADPLVRIKATPIADGLVRNGEWATMHVRLDNLGEPGQEVLDADITRHHQLAIIIICNLLIDRYIIYYLINQFIKIIN